MSKIKVNSENAFQVLAHSFSVSPSQSGYILQYSTNGVDFTSYEEATPSNENLIVNGIAKGMYFKLKNNVGDVYIQY